MIEAIMKWINDDDFYKETVEKLKETHQLLQGDERVGEYMARVINEAT